MIKILKEDGNKKHNNEYEITIKFRDYGNEVENTDLYKLLEDLKRANSGHSFETIVEPGEGQGSYYFDGDGSFRLNEIIGKLIEEEE